jgi:hypothetical protein
VLDKYRRAGDLEGFAGAAPGVISTARDFLGTSEAYGSFTSALRNTLSKLGGDPEAKELLRRLLAEDTVAPPTDARRARFSVVKGER